MDNYEEFQKIMSEINRKKELEKIKNGQSNFNFNDLFGGFHL